MRFREFEQPGKKDMPPRGPGGIPFQKGLRTEIEENRFVLKGISFAIDYVPAVDTSDLLRLFLAISYFHLMQSRM
jgi:hypothetical protein